MEAKQKCGVLVVGSGIGGLAAGLELKRRGVDDFLIVDSVPEFPLNLHNGVHYLHTDDLGLPFEFSLKEIACTEEIWNPRRDEWKKHAHIPEMMEYSMKVMGIRHPSSISDPGSRAWKTFVPASNDMNDLLLACRDYIGAQHFLFGSRLAHFSSRRAVFAQLDGATLDVDFTSMISTIPLPALFRAAAEEPPAGTKFVTRPIHITNYVSENMVPNWLVSIYISDAKFPPYRITILNGLISMESLEKMTPHEESIVKYHLERYFDYDLSTVTRYTWPSGRIWGIDKTTREKIQSDFHALGVELIGRYGCWDGKLTMDTTIAQAKETIERLLK